MDDIVDHYSVLGLPSGKEGSKLSEKEISKAYRAKALELHPDKRLDDPHAHDNFQKLKSSYEILKDEKARKLFDDLLEVRRDQQRRKSQQDGKKRKMMSDLEERERSAFEPDPAARAREEEERIARRLKEEIERIRAKHMKKGAPEASKMYGDDTRKESVGRGSGIALDKEKVLKVSWECVGEGYSVERLRELFSKFGEVEDVVLRGPKKRRSAFIVMGSKEAVAAATGTMCGDISNPLLVVPLQRATQMEFQTAEKAVESEQINNIVGPGYQAYEAAVLQKLKDAAKKQK